MGIKKMSQQQHPDSISNGMIKKIVLFSGLFLLLGFAPQVLAQSGFVPLAPIPGLTQGVAADSAGLANFFNNLYKYLIGLAATLAVIQITWSGIEIAMNKDDVSKIMDDKGKIYNAIFGLVLVLSPVLVFSIINPSILNLSVNLPPLDTKSTGALRAGSGTGASGTQTTTTDTNGCIVRSGQYLETATCPDQTTVSSYSCKNGLTPTVGNCVADQSGNCVSEAKVYCGKSTDVVYYKATHLLGLIPGLDSTIIPRDAQIQSVFTAACNADGGNADISTGKLSALAGYAGGSCPTNSGITYNTADQWDVICYKKTLSCIPK